MRKIALITGGSSGIGAACVREFAQAGYAVVFLANRGTDRAQALTDRLREMGQDVAWYGCDIADADRTAQVCADILREYRRVDVLVNCAGIAHIGLLTDMTEAQWRHLFAVNVDGVFHLVKGILPQMVRRKSGAIVNISSMWGETGASCEAAYSATKAAIIGLTKALAKEVGPSGVRVNCVTPGVIDTAMNAQLTDEDRAALEDETPLCRVGQPEEVARAVRFLAEDGASFITGQILGVSGGMVI